MRENLTREQRERDYDYMWKVLKTSFPLRGAMQRLGYDWDQIEAECRPAVLDAKDDLEFCRALNKVFEKFDHFAHTNLLNPMMFSHSRKLFNDIAAGKTDSTAPDGMGAWIKAFSDPRSEEFYADFDDSRAAGRDFYWKGEAPELKTAPPARREGPQAKGMMLPGRIAYFKVPTLAMEIIPVDRPVFFDFYEKYKWCEHLVLDFRGNGGGATNYWGKLIVAPIIKENLIEYGRMLLNINPINREFIEDGLGSYGEFEGEFCSVDEVSKLPNFHEEYLSQADTCFKFQNNYKPDPDHRFEVKQKIWLLTDKKVYSSAEGFAKFCKSTGWAIIVGGVTGGDGGSMTPSYAVLPESGLVMRYKGVNNINADGGSNAEFHTQPDILCEPELALAKCLEEIAKEGNTDA